MLEDLKEKAGELRSKEVELKERELAVVRRQVQFYFYSTICAAQGMH